jgi:hypothetical protein
MENQQIIAALIGAAGTGIPWLVDRLNLLQVFNKTKFNITGKWVGWSQFLNIGTPQINAEHFFKVEAEFHQRGTKLKMFEKITNIYDAAGNEIKMTSAREFNGVGNIYNDTNILINLTEKKGLTCASTFLIIGTWGNELSGLMAVRNTDGNAVSVKLFLVPESSQTLSIEQMVEQLKLSSTQPQMQITQPKVNKQKLISG